MMWETSRQCGDDWDDRGTMGTTCGDHRPWRPHGDLLGTPGTMWERHGDDRDDVGTMRGRWGPHGDNKITKNAITFEQIKIIEFHLKIWDP